MMGKRSCTLKTSYDIISLLSQALFCKHPKRWKMDLFTSTENLFLAHLFSKFSLREQILKTLSILEWGVDSTYQEISTISKRSWSRVIKLSFPQHIKKWIKGQDSIRCCELGAEVQDQESFSNLDCVFVNCICLLWSPLFDPPVSYQHVLWSIIL